MIRLPFRQRSSDTVNDVYGIEYRDFTTLRLLHIVFFGMIIFGCAFAAFFLHTHVFRAIENAQNIVLLTSELGVETLDVPLYETVQAQWEEKHRTRAFTAPRDPFIFQTPAASPTTTQSEPVFATSSDTEEPAAPATK